MYIQPHLSKRGDVYQWRRKSRRFSTGIVDIKLSLGATDRREALILCRKAHYTTLVITGGISNHGETAAFGSDLSSLRI